MTLPGWLREPLVHFLLAGLALFALAEWVEPGGGDERTIVIGRSELRDYLQAQARLYDDEQFDALLDAMTPEERAALVEEAAVAEALWREGAAIGLAERDPAVRARIIQQMRLVLLEEAGAEIALPDAEVRAFYDAHRDRYAGPGGTSFTHVFLRDSEARARDMLATLRAADARDAGSYGDRFAYNRVYANASAEEIASQFGDGFAQALAGVGPGSWQGPIASDHGWHLVLVYDRQAASAPAFEDIATQVREDALADARAAAIGSVLGDLLDGYDVRVEVGLAGP